MKRITLTVMVIAGTVTAVSAVRAQVPPTPPARPVEPTRPTPAPAPIARPVSPVDIDEMFDRVQQMKLNGLDRLDLDATRRAMDEVRAQQVEINEAAREASRLAFEDARWARQDAMEAARASTKPLRDVWQMAPMAPMPELPPMPAMAPIARPLAFGGVSDGMRLPSPQWFQGDPADSAYRVAYDALSRGDYGRAAQLFRDVAQKYPKSSYQNELPYWEAYARYRIGSTDELHNAARLLEPRASKLVATTTPSSSNGPRGEGFYYGKRGASDADVVALYVRVNSVLAQRGDRDAAGVIASAAKAGVNTCDREDMNVKAEALNALYQMDPATALPRIKGVLEKRDECSTELRRRAVFILGRRGDAEAATLLAATAKSDTSVSVRVDAISWLPKLQGDAGVSTLEDLLRTEKDETIQRSVVRTLVSSNNPKAQSSMRALIDRKDAPINLRIEAINSFNNDRATADDAAYLRALYARADNDQIKTAIIRALSRMGGSENDTFILGIVKNQNESSQLRSAAISGMMRSNMPVADIGRLYDAADARNIRMSLVNMLDRRNEPEAADKLFDIAKNSTDQSVKMQAFNALLRRKDERTKQLLNEFIDGKKP